MQIMEQWLPGATGWETRDIVKGNNFQLRRMRKFRRSNVQKALYIHYNIVNNTIMYI